ncbi:MAG: radical SAM protein, partial [Muribaculaceae bacterium]|nr:radical SAM protein [Muribaculaceae bacterium]
VQTMMLRGEHDGVTVDNTTTAEIDALIAAYRRIRPRSIMLYSIDRQTPAEHLRKVEVDELRAIADHISSATSIPVTTA